ncbi:hypothetical protein Vafri_732 [Volvox africanus]|nr:hypothetical protein Vafri_732 [Volvox africanus]
MPPRGAVRHATQTQGDAVAGPSGSGPTFPEYVAFTVGQAVISEGCLPEAEVKAMVRRLTQRNMDDAYLPVITKLQHDIHFLGVSIERVKFPWNDQWYVCLVDKEKDEASKQMGAKYSPDQVQYLRSVVNGRARLETELGLALMTSPMATMQIVLAGVLTGCHNVSNELRRGVDSGNKLFPVKKGFKKALHSVTRWYSAHGMASGHGPPTNHGHC